jgi:hypothetical protein
LGGPSGSAVGPYVQGGLLILGPSCQCSEWNQMLGDPGSRNVTTALTHYVEGVIDGVILITGADLFNEWDFDSVGRWITRYCAAHPSDQFIREVPRALFAQLRAGVRPRGAAQQPQDAPAIPAPRVAINAPLGGTPCNARGGPFRGRPAC